MRCPSRRVTALRTGVPRKSAGLLIRSVKSHKALLSEKVTKRRWFACSKGANSSLRVKRQSNHLKIDEILIVIAEEKKLGLMLSNNHAFRMALNSYVYVPMGLPVTERAKLLGHSVETNLKCYTFARTEDYIDELCEKMNAYNGEMNDFTPFGGRGTWGYPKIFDFNAKKESLESAKIQAFS